MEPYKITPIKFDKPTEFLGRNGQFICTALDIELYDRKKWVVLTPITSKGMCGRAELNIPAENIPGLILKLVTAHNKLRPESPINVNLYSYHG